MQKLAWLISLIAFVIFISKVLALTCSIKSTCAAGEYCIFSTYQRNDTHAGNCSAYTANKLCCSDPYLTSTSVGNFCRIGEFSFLAFHNWTDAHSETFNGSVLELRFEENFGDLTFDSSGKGNHGKIYGASWVDGRFGKALSFDGADDYVEVPDTASLKAGSAITIEAWVKPTPPHQQQFGGIINNINGRGNSRLLIQDNGIPLAQVSIAGAYQNVYGPSAVNGAWNHVVYVYDGSQEFWVVNGVKGNIYPKTGALDTGTYSRTIGWGYTGTTYYHLNGTIDEVRIYNRALSEQEIKATYYQHRVCVSCPWSCQVKTSCSADETCIASLYQLSDTHLAECGYYNYQLCCKREDIPPSYSNLGQNTTFIYPGEAIKLYAYWKDNGNVSYVILATNETGSWENKTTYGSPLHLNFFEGWSNFTWQNSSIQSGTTIAWKLYANESCGNSVVTPEQTFVVATPISLKDTTGVIPLKGWGEVFTFKVNVSHAEGYTVNVSLWYSYSSLGPWYFLDSQNCTACSSETQLIFSSAYFDCSKFANAVNGRFWYKFNATDYAGGFNETPATYFDTRKDNTQATVIEGAQSNIERYGANIAVLKVGIIDTDKSEAVPVGRNCSIFVGSKRYNFGTDATGNCTLNFDPDCSANYFSPGIYDWLGGINETDACYNATNSTKTNVTVWGLLFATLENPSQGSSFPPGSQINVTGNVTSDCYSQEGLITAATSSFELKLNTTTTWESCSPVNEFATGYYNCTWNSTGKPGGYYDVRFNSSKETAYYRNASSTYPSRFYLQPLVSIEISSKLAEGMFFTNDEGSDTNRQLPVKITQWNNATWNYHGWWNLSWNRRKRILINNSANPNELTDYQVFINITYDSDMQSDFSDLRFTWYNSTSRDEENISYWVENYSSSSYAEVWIKIPRIRARGYETVWVYYGNTSIISSESNGTLTFDFFDDFIDNRNNWVWMSGSGSITTFNGISVLNYTGGSCQYVVEQARTVTAPAILDARVYSWAAEPYNGGFDWPMVNTSAFGGDECSGTSGDWYLYAPLSNNNANARLYRHSGTTYTNLVDLASSHPTNTWVRWTLVRNGRYNAYYLNGSKIFEHTDSVDLSQGPGYIGWREGEIYIDWIVIRKYTSPEPTYSVGEEESKPLEKLETKFWIKNTGTNPEDFCLKANADLTCSAGTCTGATISIDNAAWNNSTFNNATYPSFDTTKRLSLTYQKVAYAIEPNNYIYLRFWLYVPAGKPSGTYNTTFQVRVVEAGSTC